MEIMHNELVHQEHAPPRSGRRYDAQSHRAEVEAANAPIVMIGTSCDSGCGRQATTVLPLLVRHPHSREEEVAVDQPLCTPCYLQRAPRVRLPHATKSETLRLILQHGIDVDPYPGRPVAAIVMPRRPRETVGASRA